jgi:hypothetical protein
VEDTTDEDLNNYAPLAEILAEADWKYRRLDITPEVSLASYTSLRGESQLLQLANPAGGEGLCTGPLSWQFIGDYPGQDPFDLSLMEREEQAFMHFWATVLQRHRWIPSWHLSAHKMLLDVVSVPLTGNPGVEKLMLFYRRLDSTNGTWADYVCSVWWSPTALAAETPRLVTNDSVGPYPVGDFVIEDASEFLLDDELFAVYPDTEILSGPCEDDAYAVIASGDVSPNGFIYFINEDGFAQLFEDEEDVVDEDDDTDATDEDDIEDDDCDDCDDEDVEDDEDDDSESIGDFDKHFEYACGVIGTQSPVTPLPPSIGVETTGYPTPSVVGDFAATHLLPAAMTPQPKEIMSNYLAKKSTVERVKLAVKQGAAVAIADEAGNAMLEIGKAILIGDDKDGPAAIAIGSMLNSAQGRSLLKLTAATALMQACNSGLIDEEEYPFVGTGADLVVQAAARDLLQPRMALLTTQLGKLSAAGRRAVKMAAEGGPEAGA